MNIKDEINKIGHYAIDKLVPAVAGKAATYLLEEALPFVKLHFKAGNKIITLQVEMTVENDTISNSQPTAN